MKYLALMTALVFTGCAPYMPATLLPSHPASGEADSAPDYPASTTLDVVSESDVTKTFKAKATKGPMPRVDSTMGGMDHAGH